MSNTSVSIESVENLLPKELLELLQPFQIDQIKNMISSFLVMNFSVHEYVFEYCPKCGVHHPVLIKAGKANSGKQMIYAALFRIQELYRKTNRQGIELIDDAQAFAYNIFHPTDTK